MQSLAPGKEQLPAKIQAEDCLSGDQLCGKNAGAVVGNKVSMGQQHLQAAKGANRLLRCVNRHIT